MSSTTSAPLLAYEVSGQADPAAPVVVLSSGLGGAGAFWRPQLDELRSRYRVITYDQRGTGRNAMPLAQDYAIADMAGDVLSILDDAGVQRGHLVGHALGGLVGLQMALDRPGCLASLTLVNSWSRPNPHTARCFATRRRLLLDSGVAAYVTAQPLFLYPPAWCAEHDAEVVAEIAHGIAHFQGEDTLLKRIGALLSFDVHAALPALDVPTLVYAARDDMLVPWTCSQAMAQALPKARYVCMDSGGHACNVTQAEPFNRALMAFLAQPAAALGEPD